MAERTPTVLRGLAVPIGAVSNSSLQSTSGTPPSVLTQAGRVAGVPASVGEDSAVTLRAHGTPTGDTTYYLDTSRGGMVGDGDARFKWRNSASGTFFGTDNAGAITDWQPVKTAGLATVPRASMLRMGDGTICAFMDSGNVGVQSYDSDTAAWTETAIGSATGCDVAAVLVPHADADNGERLVAYHLTDTSGSYDASVDVYVSDDGPDGTWTCVGRAVLAEPVEHDGTAGSASISIRAAYQAGAVVLAIEHRDTTNVDVSIYASANPYGPFRRTVQAQSALSTADVKRPDVVALPGGGFWVSWVVTTGDNYEGYLVPYASASYAAWEQVLSDTAPQDTGPNRYPDATHWIGEDGRLWRLWHHSAGAGAGDGLALAYSDDDGRTFVEWAGRLWYDGVGTEWFDGFGAIDLGGSVCIVNTHTQRGGIAALWMGGYSTHTTPGGDSGYLEHLWATYGDEPSGGSGRAGGAYLPNETPTNTNWTTSGAGSQSISGQLLALSCSAGQTAEAERTVSDQSNLNDGDNTQVFAEICVRVDSGSDYGAGVELTLSDKDGGAGTATFEYHVGIRCGLVSSELKYQVWDEAGSAQVGSTQDTGTDGLVRIRVAVDSSGRVKTWYSPDGTKQLERSWTEGPGGSGLTDDSASNNGSSVRFGRIWGVGAQDATFSMVGYTFWPFGWGPANTSEIATAWNAPDDVTGIPYSVRPRYLSGGVSVSAAGGPAYGVVEDSGGGTGDQFTAAPGYTYGVENVDWRVQASPAVTWRSTANTLERLFWDLGSSTRQLVGSLALGVFRANVPSVKLVYWDGAAVQTFGTLDLTDGLASLGYTLTGNVLTINTGAGGHTDATRYLYPHELKGATIAFPSSVYQKVEDNSGGVWSASAGKTPIIRLADTTGVASSGVMTIWRRSGVLVVHEATTAHRYIGVELPAQTNKDGYFEAGILAPCWLHAFGDQYGHGRRTETTVPTSSSSTPGGGSVVNVQGLGRRVTSFGWPDGVVTHRLYTSAPAPDYVSGTDGGEALASIGGTLEDLGWLVRHLQGDATPCLYLPKVPRGSGSHSLTDPGEFMWCRVDPRLSVEPFTGDELDSEIQRSGTVVVREIPGSWEV